METSTQSILALDIGDRRIGVALADTNARLPRPLTTIERGEDVIAQIEHLVRRHGAVKLVVGLPRGLSGQSTGQTEQTLKFVEQIKSAISLPLQLQDEALTSVLAEKELAATRTTYKKADIDALAAVYILQDYFAGETKHV
jgi:putative Holliday junction resolvase